MVRNLARYGKIIKHIDLFQDNPLINLPYDVNDVSESRK